MNWLKFLVEIDLNILGVPWRCWNFYDLLHGQLILKWQNCKGEISFVYYMLLLSFLKCLYITIKLMQYLLCIASGQVVFCLWLQDHSSVHSKSFRRSASSSLLEILLSLYSCLHFIFLITFLVRFYLVCLTTSVLNAEPNPESPLNSYAATLWNNKEGRNSLYILFYFFLFQLMLVTCGRYSFSIMHAIIFQLWTLGNCVMFVCVTDYKRMVQRQYFAGEAFESWCVKSVYMKKSGLIQFLYSSGEEFAISRCSFSL